MSASLQPVFRESLEQEASAFDGRALIEARQELFDRAERANALPLDTFTGYYSSLEEVAEDVREELPDDAVSPPAWYDPDDGLKTVRALLASFTADGGDGKFRLAVAALRELERLLVAASQAGTEFRLEIQAQ